MLALQRLNKPWFIHRPSQIARRLRLAWAPPAPGFSPLRTSWGAELSADPTKTIGHNILATGLYDIAVSEALARLIAPGAWVVDAGANIGHMTVLAALAAGPAGQVIAFEPHPGLAEVLRTNVRRASQTLAVAPVEVRQSALGDEAGQAELSIPNDFDGNDGIAAMASVAQHSGICVRVQVETLDEVLGTRAVDVMKIDVEGFELQALRGAMQTLQARRIRHIVFEDHAWADSAVMRLLADLGYSVHALGWTLQGLSVRPIAQGVLAVRYEAPNFIATLDAPQMMACCAGRGWRVLHPNLGR